MPRLYDISPAITPDLAVFPGDTPMSREVLLEIARGDNITLSTLRATVHLGAHADAPSHYGKNARTIDQQSLELYIGPCEVVTVSADRSGLIQPDDLPRQLRTKRLLLHTGSYPDPNNWRDDFTALAPETADALRERGVRLVGIDTPSVDPASAKELRAHQRFLAHDMAILEGIVLNQVPDGEYELIALPLKLVGFDASPVRAILRTID